MPGERQWSLILRTSNGTQHYMGPPLLPALIPAKCICAVVASLLALTVAIAVAVTLSWEPGIGSLQLLSDTGAHGSGSPVSVARKESRARVAILFSGQPRFLTGISTQTFRRFLLDPYDCDVYAAFGYRSAKEESAADMRLFNETYRPLALVTYVDDPAGVRARVFPPPSVPRFYGIYKKGGYLALLPRILMLYESLHRVAETFDRNRGSKQYDWIIRARTDTVILATLNLTTLPRGYLYFGDLSQSRGMPEWLKNDHWILPGNVPEALDILRKGINRLGPINLSDRHRCSFVDETLLHDLVYDLGLQGISRVTDVLQRMPTRDGRTVHSCGRGKHAEGFNLSKVVVFSDYNRTQPWFRTLEDVTAGRTAREDVVPVQGLTGCPFGPFRVKEF